MARVDPSLRRQLRFSLFLQAFAALMFAVAFIVRATTSGFDALTWVFGLAMALAAAAAIYTTTRLK